MSACGGDYPTDIDLDFTGTGYNTKAKCNAVGLRFSDSDTPFPDTLRYVTSGTWSHISGSGWRPTPNVDNEGPAIVFPVASAGNWEMTINFTWPYYYNRLGSFIFGYITQSNHVGAFLQHHDAWVLTNKTKGYLYTNDGDDTYTAIASSYNYTSGPFEARFRCESGAIQVELGTLSYNYEARQCTTCSYTPAYVFVQAWKYPGYSFHTLNYITRFRLTYLT